jgi:ketosteroid isomerase-like protein
MHKSLILTSLLLAATLPSRAQKPPTPREEILTFNQKLKDATASMDNAATLALWADDGISLLPSTKPIVGKPAIATFLAGVMASIQGAKMSKFEMECFAIDISGDLATEWCSEHQIVELPGGKPPFDGRGKMLLVLRKGADGHWLLEREMWNQAQPEE